MEPCKDLVKLLPEWKLRELTDVPQLVVELDRAISEWSRPVELINPNITLGECDQYWEDHPPPPEHYDRLLATQKRRSCLWKYTEGDTNEPNRFVCIFIDCEGLKELRYTVQETSPYITWSVEKQLFNHPSFGHLTFSDLRAIRLEWLKKLQEKL